MGMEFRGKLNELSFDREGRNRLTLTAFSDCRNEFDELFDKEVDVTIKPARKKRSLQANAYCWALIDMISEITGISKEEIYRENIRDIGGVSKQVWCNEDAVPFIVRAWKSRGLGWQAEETDNYEGNVCLTLYAGSSEYNTKQMSALIDRTIQDARQYGIETLTPKELDKMLGRWEKCVQKHNAG